MKEFLKTWPPLVWLRQSAEYASWRLRGSVGGAPHWEKQAVLSTYRKAFGLQILVETGTYLGDMVYAKRREFAKIYSIELAPQLFLRARKRFAAFANVNILAGDSARVLPDLVLGLDRPTLFWLDGHYSGGQTARAEQDTPVARELEAILKNIRQPFVVLIDDARLFVGQDGYPTLEEVGRMVAASRPDYSVAAESDIIRISPKMHA